MVKMLIYPEILPKFLLMGLLELLLRSYHTWSNMLETNEHIQNITLNVSHTFIAHIHTRTHTHMDTYTHGRIHTRTHTHACTTHTQSHIHAHTCTHNAAVMWKWAFLAKYTISPWPPTVYIQVEESGFPPGKKCIHTLASLIPDNKASQVRICTN